MQQNADLLGCICLYNAEGECFRNCRTDEHEPYDPSDATIVEIMCEQDDNDPASIACERLEDEEDARPDNEIIGVEAWSNGLLRIWFERIQSSNIVYAVPEGRKRGIFDTWDDCNASVNEFSGPDFKKSSSISNAKQWLDETSAPIVAPVAGIVKVSIHATSRALGIWFGPNDERNFSETTEENVSNPRAELISLIGALEKVPSEPLHIFSDSEYCVIGVNFRLKEWSRTKFVDIANSDLWQRIHELLSLRNHPVVLEQVKSGHYGISKAKSSLLSK
jgi:ribonuclease HI